MGIRNTIARNEERSGSGRRRLTKRVTIVCVVTAATLMAAGGVAIASVASRGGGMVHGCYSTTTGALRLINPAARQSCRTGEKAIQWNGAGLTWRGNWNRKIAYSVHDAVADNGSSYLATAAGAGRVPSVSPRSWSSTTPNTTLEVENPPGESSALTMTPRAGGADPVSATLVIRQLS